MQNKTIHTLELERSNSNGRVKPIQYFIDNNGCYVCVSHKGNSKGYVAIRVDGVQNLMHKYLYKMFVGEVPEGQIIMHKCDNPKCLNQEHYTTGTIGDNNIDAYTKGRRDQANNVRLSNEQKIELCENKDNLKNSEIREKYGIGESTIKDIRKAFREGKFDV